jgi:hypothetical protein
MPIASSIVFRARAGPINRKLGRVVVEVDHRCRLIPWETEVEIRTEAGIHEVLAYLVLADSPWPLARFANRARATVEILDGSRRRVEYRPSRLFSAAWHGRLRVSDVEL